MNKLLFALTLLGPTTSFAAKRELFCLLELQKFNPWERTLLAQSSSKFDGNDLSTLKASTRSKDYICQVQNNAPVPYNLSLEARILDRNSKTVAYQVLPKPTYDGKYLFELGASIPSVLLKNEKGETTYDSIRCYCGASDPT